jgi:signal recognition particle receptor subunit beta
VWGSFTNYLLQIFWEKYYMEIMRLVVRGTVGAGKPTLISSISEIEVVDTDTRSTD